jgi:hypothetical protein
MDREVPMLQSHARRNVIRFPSLRDYFLPQLQQSLCTLKIEPERGPSVLFRRAVLADLNRKGVLFTP